MQDAAGASAPAASLWLAERMPNVWILRPAHEEDATWMADLRAVVLRADLERLGRYDERRVRTRFLDAYAPGHTQVIVVDGRDSGLVAVRPEGESLWIEHFYLDPSVQGRGIGGGVLTGILRDHADDDRMLRLNVLQGSAARRLYERHGFVLESEDAVDVFLRREPGAQGPRP